MSVGILPPRSAYLHFDVTDFVHRTDDGSADHRWENIRREVAACVSTFDKLKKEEIIKHHSPFLATNDDLISRRGLPWRI